MNKSSLFYIYLLSAFLYAPYLYAYECTKSLNNSDAKCVHVTTDSDEIYTWFLRELGYQPKRYAFIVSVNDYHPNSSYDSIRLIDDSASNVFSTFQNIDAFDEILWLSDRNVTKSRVEQYITDYFGNKLKPQDTFVFYYIGHGDTFKQGSRTMGRLALSDSLDEVRSSFIDMHELKSWYYDISHASHILFLLDACFSGSAGVQSLSPAQNKLYLRERGHHLITAGTRDQKSYGVDDGSGSFFSRALLEALVGNADTTTDQEKDGVVTTHEIYRYVKDNVTRLAAQHGKRQYPELFGYDNFSPNVGEAFFVYDNSVASIQLSKAPALSNTPVANIGPKNTEFPFAGIWGGAFGYRSSERLVAEIQQDLENLGLRKDGLIYRNGKAVEASYRGGHTYPKKPDWMASKSTVFYYDSETKLIAESIVERLLDQFGIRADLTDRGAGHGVVNRERNIFIHLVDEWPNGSFRNQKKLAPEDFKKKMFPPFKFQ